MKVLSNKYPISLREYLTREGFLFPCGGKGVCGRCRIIAPDLPVTALDRKFLSDSEIAAGLRLACDKVVDRETEIECRLSRAPTVERVYKPYIAAVLSDDRTEITIIDEDKIIETVVLPPSETDGRSLRAAVQKNAIELFEKYHVAKAIVILLAGSYQRIKTLTGLSDGEMESGGTYAAADFDMPAEEVYIVPGNAVAGSDKLLDAFPLVESAEASVRVAGNALALLTSNRTKAKFARFAADAKNAT